VDEWRRPAEALRTSLIEYFPSLRPGPDVLVSHEEDNEECRPRAQTLVLRRADLRPALFDYQRDLSEQVVDLVQQRGTGLLALPTGAGKTRTAVVGLLSAYARSDAARTVWLAPSIELVDQAAQTFESVWREFGTVPDVVLERGREPPVGGPSVWLTTPQSIYSRGKRRRNVGSWDTVVFDEAHQLGARTFRGAVDFLRPPAEPGHTSLLGLSATPGRLNPDETEDLVDMFKGNLLRSRRLAPNPIRALQRRGVLARLDFQKLKPAEPGGMVGRFRSAAVVARDAVAAGGRMLAFAGNVPEAIVFSEVLTAVGISARALHSKHTEWERRAILQSFQRGDLRGIVNQRLLATGYDCPGVTDLILLAKIGSPILFEQIVGRGARGPRIGGSATAVIWDFDDHLSTHGLPKSYYRYQDFDWR